MSENEYEYEYSSEEEDKDEEEDEDEYMYEDMDDDDDENSSSNAYFAVADNDNNNVKKKSDTTKATTCTSSSVIITADASSSSSAAMIRMVPAEELFPEMQRRISDVAEALGIPKSAATALLLQHNTKFSTQTLLQNYYVNPRIVLQQAGVSYRCGGGAVTAATVQDDDCPICFDTMDNNNHKLSMPCGHTVCLDCGKHYIQNAIENEGPACVYISCPFSTCTEAITEIEVQMVCTPDLVAKYQTYQLRNFVESNALTRWCPGKGCERVAYCSGGAASGRTSLDGEPTAVYCDSCQSNFCLSCGDESHTPVSCRDLAFWQDKCRNESESANWITANTKSCPKCCARIHKDGGCMHMTCRQCQHSFCWNCMGNHHVWNCNEYKDDNDDNDRERAKNELERYLHYYQRYHGHGQAQTFAEQQLEKMKIQETTMSSSPLPLSTLDGAKKDDDDDDDAEADKESPSTSSSQMSSSSSSASPSSDDNGVFSEDVSFLIDANRQLVECRRVLKYTYVFAYRQFVNVEDTKKQKECFEHHQGTLEGLTEALSKVTEKPMSEIDKVDVINRTRVIGQFIKNVLEYVDSGMMMMD